MCMLREPQPLSVVHRSHVKSQVYSKETTIEYDRVPPIYCSLLEMSKIMHTPKSKDINVNTCYQYLVLMSA